MTEVFKLQCVLEPVGGQRVLKVRMEEAVKLTAVERENLCAIMLDSLGEYQFPGEPQKARVFLAKVAGGECAGIRQIGHD